VPIRAVIFDMDGLMLDTEPSYRAAWQRASAQCGYTLSDADYVNFIGRSTVEAEKLLLRIFGEKFPLEEFRVSCEQAESDVFTGKPFLKKPGLEELLAFLEARNIRKAVATSTVRRRALPRLEAAGLAQRFEFVTTGDEVSKGKPSPDLFLLAAQRFGIDASGCLVLEDSEPGVMAAIRAGMRVYLVPDLNAPSETCLKLATATFDSLSAIVRHLEQRSDATNCTDALMA
jgi:beta-phosphoglucomutase-like phosphatase (HAD superfamily)